MSMENLKERYEKVLEMSCVPISLRKLREGAIIDEDKSVKWNREQVVSNNEAYQREVARLNTVKNKARDLVEKDIIKEIQEEVGHNLSKEKARFIWEKAYDKDGLYEIFTELDNLIDFAYEILR